MSPASASFTVIDRPETTVPTGSSSSTLPVKVPDMTGALELHAQPEIEKSGTDKKSYLSFTVNIQSCCNSFVLAVRSFHHDKMYQNLTKSTSLCKSKKLDVIII